MSQTYCAISEIPVDLEQLDTQTHAIPEINVSPGSSCPAGRAHT